MKNLDVDWLEFIDALAVYKRLSVPAKASLIANGPYSNPVPKSRFGSMQHQVLENGMFTLSPTGGHFVMHPQYRGFAKAMRAIHRSRIDVQPDVPALDLYLADNFTRAEWMSLAGEYHYEPMRNQAIVAITSPEWLESFLRTDGTEWNLHSADDSRWNIPDANLLRSLQAIVRKLRNSPEPWPFEKLAETCPDRNILGPCIATGLRYALFYPLLNRETLDPYVWIWPGISRRLHQPPVTAPREVKVRLQFQAPFLVDDMTVVLAAAAAEPLRLLANSYTGIYQKHMENLAPRLVEFPDWINGYLKINQEGRVSDAVHNLNRLDYLDRAKEDGKVVLAITKKGKLWLALSPKDRMTSIVQPVRDASERRTGRFNEDLSGCLARHAAYEYGPDLNLEREVRDALRGIGKDVFVRLVNFLEYQLSANPLANVNRRRGYQRRSNDELDNEWKTILVNALVPRLFQLGGVELGADENGGLCFRVTQIGRYVLGQAPDFEMAAPEPEAKIIVQPNFDVMFMTQAPRIEAELGRFAERQAGRRVGVLFKITKKATYRAAAGGLTADRVIETLAAVSSVAIPANVEREIRGWFAQCRSVEGHSAYLIHCPDPETAARVVAADSGKLTPLTDKIVHLKDPSYRPKLVKKLREAGIFL